MMIFEKKVFKSQPESLMEVVCVVHQLESARKACCDSTMPSVDQKKSVDVVSASEDSVKISRRFANLKNSFWV